MGPANTYLFFIQSPLLHPLAYRQAMCLFSGPEVSFPPPEHPQCPIDIIKIIRKHHCLLFSGFLAFLSFQNLSVSFSFQSARIDVSFGSLWKDNAIVMCLTDFENISSLIQ